MNKVKSTKVQKQKITVVLAKHPCNPSLLSFFTTLFNSPTPFYSTFHRISSTDKHYKKIFNIFQSLSALSFLFDT